MSRGTVKKNSKNFKMLCLDSKAVRDRANLPYPLLLFRCVGVTKRQEGYLVFFYCFGAWLGYFSYLSGESFVARFKVKDFSWIVVYPFFHGLYFFFGVFG